MIHAAVFVSCYFVICSFVIFVSFVAKFYMKLDPKAGRASTVVFFIFILKRFTIKCSHCYASSSVDTKAGVA